MILYHIWTRFLGGDLYASIYGIQCLLKMSLNDVNKLGTIAYEEVVHVKRAFHTGGYAFNDRVDFQREECNREYAALWNTHLLVKYIRDT